MAAKSIFVSHISQEGEYAGLLKCMIEEDFLGLVQCFTSSDLTSIAAGENWLAAVESGLRKATGMLVLCSKASLQRQWVHVEVGAAWMTGIPIVPVCHSGMKKDDLEIPLSLRQGVELPSERGVAKLYAGIARILEVPRPPLPGRLDERLRRMGEIEARLARAEAQEFGAYIDIVLPPPGRLEGSNIPDDTVVELQEASLQLFNLLKGTRCSWRDIVSKAHRIPDTRWLDELQRSIVLASNNEQFRPVQGIYHSRTGSYQPHLSRREVRTDGSICFHVQFIETALRPLC